MTKTIGASTFHPLQPVPIQDVAIEDEFWMPRRETWRSVTIPYCFDRFEQDGAAANFDRVIAGQSGGHRGRPWYDGLMYEMIRACADFLAERRDANLEDRLDGYIERVAAAQAPDGYVNTYTQLMVPAQRWGMNGGDDLWQHDVYNAGALVEAGVHYYLATGKPRLLAVAVKAANHLCAAVGPPPKANVVPGHAIAEEAFVKLYRLLRDRPDVKGELGLSIDEGQYLRLSEFWIENRGNHAGRRGSVTNWAEYAQDHLPVLQQETLEGHAVRATLLCTGLAAAAIENRREDYLAAATRLWHSMVDRRMYITGGVGARHQGESFAADYDLPNDGYLETCAAVAAAFFHGRMNQALGDARAMDELERVFHNGILCGVSLAGNTFTYANPLEASMQARWAWHACPCCPPMFLKAMAALPGYIYAQDGDGLYVNLFVGSQATLRPAGEAVRVRQATRYPWDGRVMLVIEPAAAGEFAIYLRLPGWCDGPQIVRNGQPIASPEIVRGYARIPGPWQPGDTVELRLPMPVRRMKAHPRVAAAHDRVALMRGPLVYCLEDADHELDVVNLVLPPGSPARAEHRPEMLGGVTVITGQAQRWLAGAWPESLYLPAEHMPGLGATPFTAIPYYANANRQGGHMSVWLRDSLSPLSGS